MTREEVKQIVDKSILLIPIATIEQHGPHLPLHTDIDNVTSIVLEVAKRLNPKLKVVAGAPIWFSPGGFDPKIYPGTVHMRKEIFMEALNDLLESYLRGEFKRIVVINGHGAETQIWIPEAIRALRRKISSGIPGNDWKEPMPKDSKIIVFTWISFLGEFAKDELAKIRKNPIGSGCHAGDIETSLQLYLRPDLVDMSKAKKGDTFPSSKFAFTDIFNWHREYILEGYSFWGTKEEKGEVEGVWGDPTLATKELGKKVFDLAVKKISEFIQEFASLENNK